MQARVTCVITARPSYARAKTALDSLIARHVPVEVVCVASALEERYGAVVEQVRRDGLPVTWVGHTHIEGDAAKTMGLTTMELAGVFRNTRPSAVITIADRSETLATAVAASYQDLPLIHLQGGEVTGNIDDKVRHAITQLADLHLVSTAAAAARVRAMRPDAEVIVTGCPSLDIAACVDSAPVVELPGHGYPLDLTAPFLLVLQHPVTDEAADAGRQVKSIQRAVEQVGLPVVWFWPNPDQGTDAVSKALRTWEPDIPVRFVRQVPPADFIRLMRQCAVMVGNSSAGIREGSFLGTPVVNVGTRQRGRERGENVVDVAPQARAVLEAIRGWLGRPRPEPSWRYGDGAAGLRVADAICAWLNIRSRKTVASVA